MIYSRFGNPVCKVTSGDVAKNHIDVIFYDGKNKKSKVEKTFISELKADNGFNEIAAAISDPSIYSPTETELENYFNNHCK